MWASWSQNRFIGGCQIEKGVRIAPLSGLLIDNRGLERVVVDVSFGGLRIEFLEMRLFGTRRSSDAALLGTTDTATSVPQLLQHIAHTA